MNEELKVSKNVRSVLNVLKEDPLLLRDLNKSLTLIFARADVRLTVDEKKAFFYRIAETIKSEAMDIHVHL